MPKGTRQMGSVADRIVYAGILINYTWSETNISQNQCDTSFTRRKLFCIVRTLLVRCVILAVQLNTPGRRYICSSETFDSFLLYPCDDDQRDGTAMATVRGKRTKATRRAPTYEVQCPLKISTQEEKVANINRVIRERRRRLHLLKSLRVVRTLAAVERSNRQRDALDKHSGH